MLPSLSFILISVWSQKQVFKNAFFYLNKELLKGFNGYFVFGSDCNKGYLNNIFIFFFPKYFHLPLFFSLLPTLFLSSIFFDFAIFLSFLSLFLSSQIIFSYRVLQKGCSENCSIRPCDVILWLRLAFGLRFRGGKSINITNEYFYWILNCTCVSCHLPLHFA